MERQQGQLQKKPQKNSVNTKKQQICLLIAQLLQPSLAFCFSLQPMTANEGFNSCASLAGLVLSFIACFTYTCDRSLLLSATRVGNISSESYLSLTLPGLPFIREI